VPHWVHQGSTLVPAQYHSGVHFLAGGVAEFCSSILFVPFDVVRSRLQLGCNPNRATGGLVPDIRNYPSISAALSSIWRKEVQCVWRKGALSCVACFRSCVGTGVSPVLSLAHPHAPFCRGTEACFQVGTHPWFKIARSQRHSLWHMKRWGVASCLSPLYEPTVVPLHITLPHSIPCALHPS
jgi:hypothetical protein